MIFEQHNLLFGYQKPSYLQFMLKHKILSVIFFFFSARNNWKKQAELSMHFQRLVYWSMMLPCFPAGSHKGYIQGMES